MSSKDDKRMTDAELEAVSGGVAPALNPAAVQALLGAATANSGAYAVTTTAPTTTVAPTATIASHDPVINPDFNQGMDGLLHVTPPPSSETVSTVTGHVTIEGNFNINIPQPTPPPTVTLMTFSSSSGGFTEVTPTVTAQQSGSGPDYEGEETSHSGPFMPSES